MRLKKIKLSGFKSFVDPTSIHFPSNLVAIVGPNGCGKSNIIDAIRWVMGESSAKSLRGESMSDVIFNGASLRNPVACASVELLFDNSDGTLTGEYAHYSEIGLKREVTRDGQSEYSLNGTPCRKKDIVDLFFGTGLGSRSYSIISQGMISNFIEAKPEDLKIYLEEAAGISKYKDRRKETESRMQRTRENLERVSDLQQELDKQLEKLRRQARDAEKYKTMTEALRLLKAQTLALRWQDLHNTLEGEDRKLSKASSALETLHANRSGAELALDTLKLAQEEKNQIFHQTQSTYYTLRSELMRLEDTEKHNKERKNQWEQDLRQCQENLSRSAQHFEQDLKEIEQLKTELAAIHPKRLESEAHDESMQKQWTAANETKRCSQEASESAARKSAECLRIKEVTETQIMHMSASIEKIKARIETLTSEQQQAPLDPIDAKLLLLTQKETELQESLAPLKHNLEQTIVQITEVRARNQDLTRACDACKHKKDDLQSALKTLHALQNTALSKNDTHLHQWLEKQGVPDLRLAETLKVTPGWELAVETVLMPYLQAICLKDFDSLPQILREISHASVTFLKESAEALVDSEGGTDLHPLLIDKVGPATDFVQTLLKNIYTASDLNEALIWFPTLEKNHSIITPDGIWLHAAWVKKEHFAEDGTQGVLQRAQEIRTREAALEAFQIEYTQAERALETNQQTLAELEGTRVGLQEALTQIDRELTHCHAEIQIQQNQLTHVKQHHERIASDLKNQCLALDLEKQKLVTTQEALRKLTGDAEEAAFQYETLQKERVQSEGALRDLQTQVQKARETKHALEVQWASFDTALTTRTQNLEHHTSNRAQLEERLHHIEEALVHIQPPEDFECILKEKLTAHESLLSEVKAHEATLEQWVQDIKTKEKANTVLNAEIQQAQTALENLRLERQTLSVKCSTLEESLAETTLALPDVLQALPILATLPIWEEKAQTLSQKIERLGAINLAAIDECETEEARKNALEKQVQDLTEALKMLEDAIRKIDQETCARFKQTYDRVNANFQTLFPKLLGGGKASLSLNSEDLLETGITVMAQPLGKRNTSIHLLSGGEKAMTAVALVFAIFQLNPAPFCMLDEVDAPLDDANVARFCALVKEMSQTIQFIFISHNKLSMELADTLLGVTMRDPGISKLVAIDVEEALSLSEDREDPRHAAPPPLLVARVEEEA